MSNYFKSEYGHIRTRHELNIIKLVKAYQYFVGEIKKCSEEINKSNAVDATYDNNVIQLYNGMRGLVDSVNLYAFRLGISRFRGDEYPLSYQVNDILSNGIIVETVDKYSKILSSDNLPPVKRRKNLASKNFVQNLWEGLNNINLPNTSKRYNERVMAAIGSAVESAYGTNNFEVPTCRVMAQEDKYIKVKSPLPVDIEDEFERLGLSSGKTENPVVKPLVKTCLLCAPKRKNGEEILKANSRKVSKNNVGSRRVRELNENIK